MEITFLNPAYLLLALGIPFLIILHFYALKYVKLRALKFANFEALKRVTGGRILSRNINLLVLRLFVLLFLVLSLAGTIIWYKGDIDVADYVIAIDNSGSMLADDFEPNRLEAAKEGAIAFMENLKADSKIGVVSFAGIGLVEVPLTKERWKIKSTIEGIDINTLHGTAIGEALKTSANMLIESDKSRVVILLTDGRENVASQEELDKIINYLGKQQITVNTIGVATEAGGILPGIEALSTLDEDMLSSIANSTGGVYKHPENKEEVVEVFKSFTYESIEGKVAVPLRMPLILMVFAILFVEWILVNTRYRTIP
jgi:Ca-activated chloride channel family protein